WRLAFAALNADPVLLNFYFGAREFPLSLVMVGALGIGMLLGILSGMGVILGVKRENAQLRRREREAIAEVKNLRSLPLQDR
ncbi:DNA recombination protein RecN, partial [Candidatus Endoriftia persephone str. Guaymas]|nr:DNA recombination protein RecN [Candidatus Endoriftia persephone str. Guaymas]